MYLSKPGKSTSIWGNSWRRFRKDTTAILGTVMILIIILSIMIGPVVYQQPIDKIDFTIATLPPSWEHPFGTNDLGQDQLARVLFGGRISLAVGVAAMVVAISFGTLIGAISGYYGGMIDNLRAIR